MGESSPEGLAQGCRGPDFGLAWWGPRVDGKWGGAVNRDPKR
jgi:hypothetical protein